MILVVFLLRSFLFEPFKIPSGSMIPTLLVGDLILVNKFAYGIRLPVINTKIIANARPAARRRDGVPLPGGPERSTTSSAWSACRATRSRTANKRLTINGKPVPHDAGCADYFDEERMRYSNAVRGDARRRASTAILNNPRRASRSMRRRRARFPYRENCRYNAEGVTCKVPPGHYFMMGDNRDNIAATSRYWGFVPDENIVGRAFFIWMNFGNLKRIGSFH